MNFFVLKQSKNCIIGGKCNVAILYEGAFISLWILSVDGLTCGGLNGKPSNSDTPIAQIPVKRTFLVFENLHRVQLCMATKHVIHFNHCSR